MFGTGPLYFPGGTSWGATLYHVDFRPPSSGRPTGLQSLKGRVWTGRWTLDRGARMETEGVMDTFVQRVESMYVGCPAVRYSGLHISFGPARGAGWGGGLGGVRSRGCKSIERAGTSASLRNWRFGVGFDSRCPRLVADGQP